MIDILFFKITDFYYFTVTNQNYIRSTISVIYLHSFFFGVDSVLKKIIVHCKVLTHHGRQNNKFPCLKMLASKCLTLGNKLCYMGESRALRLQVELKFLVNYHRILGQTQCYITNSVLYSLYRRKGQCDPRGEAQCTISTCKKVLARWW